ncbi:MAG: hypothetical protein AB7T19_02640 [Planctomycetota bacterium]
MLCLSAVSSVHGQAPAGACPLTPAQEAAVDAATDKLLDCALNDGLLPGAGWPPDDPRWGALGGLLARRYFRNAWPGLGEKLQNDQLPDQARGITKQSKGRLSKDEWETVCLGKNEWKGTAKDQYLSEDPAAACWLLAGVLLHEFSHAFDDDYPWPPVAPPDVKSHACEEFDAYCWEIEILDKGIEALGPNSPEELPDTLNTLVTRKNDEARRKEGES